MKKLFTQHFLHCVFPNSSFVVLQCIQSMRNVIFTHSNTPNFIDFPVDSVKHGNTRKHPDQIMGRYAKSPTEIILYSLPIAEVVHVCIKLDMILEFGNAWEHNSSGCIDGRTLFNDEMPCISVIHFQSIWSAWVKTTCWDDRIFFSA